MSRDHPVKAYRNLSFLTSPPARPLRILAEYEEPRRRFLRHSVENTIVFFGSARARPPDGPPPAPDQAGTTEPATTGRARLTRYYEEAQQLAERLTHWSRTLYPPEQHYVVATGGGPGIMEAANRGAAAAQGLTAGLGISLPFEEAQNRFTSPSLQFEFHYFFMRKYWFAYLAKAVVAFPGGLGTLDEVLEVLTLIQTGKMTKPLPVVLYGKDFWTKVLRFDELLQWETISPEDTSLFHLSDSVDDAYQFLIEKLSAQQQPTPT